MSDGQDDGGWCRGTRETTQIDLAPVRPVGAAADPAIAGPAHRAPTVQVDRAGCPSSPVGDEPGHRLPRRQSGRPRCAPSSGTSTRSWPPSRSPTRSSSPSSTRRVCSAPRRWSAHRACPPSTRPRSTATPPAPRTSSAPRLEHAGRRSPSWGRASPAPASPSSIGPGLALKVAAGAMLPGRRRRRRPRGVDRPGRRRASACTPARRPGSYVRRTGDDVAAGRPRRRRWAPRSARRRSACWPPSAASGCSCARGRGSPCCAPAPSWSTSARRPAPGQVVDVNSYALAAAARDAGAEAYRSGHPADRPAPADRGAGEPAAAQRPGADRRAPSPAAASTWCRRRWPSWAR